MTHRSIILKEAKSATWLAIVALLVSSTAAFGRNERATFPLKPALELGDQRGKTARTVKLGFGNQGAGEVLKVLSPIKSSRTINAVGKSGREACNWALLSSLIALQERAVAMGGDAVVGIKSVAGKETVSSDAEFVCSPGALTAAVTVEGTVVKLK